MRVSILDDLPDCIYKAKCLHFMATEKKAELCSLCKYRTELDIPKMISDKVKKRKLEIKKINQEEIENE